MSTIQPSVTLIYQNDFILCLYFSSLFFLPSFPPVHHHCHHLLGIHPSISVSILLSLFCLHFSGSFSFPVCNILPQSLPPSCSCCHFHYVVCFFFWRGVTLSPSCPHLTYGSHLGLCLCPHIILPHLFLNFCVFQNFCHLFLFKFSLAPWPLFCLPLCLHHSISIYLLSGCLPALIFLFVLLHSLVPVPFLYSHLSVPICLHLSLLLPNIYILCLCLCLSFTHTHPCWFPCPSFPIWLSHFSITPFLSLLPSCWVACLMCLSHVSFSLFLCVFC